jgi:hypothetical protein
MPFFEYQCPKGHVTEMLRSIEQRNDPVACMTCVDALTPQERELSRDVRPFLAHRILSPTPTTFVCAGGRKL